MGERFQQILKAKTNQREFTVDREPRIPHRELQLRR
jgi:hypothetical protein